MHHQDKARSPDSHHHAAGSEAACPGSYQCTNPASLHRENDSTGQTAQVGVRPPDPGSIRTSSSQPSSGASCSRTQSPDYPTESHGMPPASNGVDAEPETFESPCSPCNNVHSQYREPQPIISFPSKPQIPGLRGRPALSPSSAARMLSSPLRLQKLKACQARRESPCCSPAKHTVCPGSTQAAAGLVVPDDRSLTGVTAAGLDQPTAATASHPSPASSPLILHDASASSVDQVDSSRQAGVQDSSHGHAQGPLAGSAGSSGMKLSSSAAGKSSACALQPEATYCMQHGQVPQQELDQPQDVLLQGQHAVLDLLCVMEDVRASLQRCVGESGAKFEPQLSDAKTSHKDTQSFDEPFPLCDTDISKHDCVCFLANAALNMHALMPLHRLRSC